MIPVYTCHRCDRPLERVFMIDANDNELCAACSTPVANCEHCGEACPTDDRLPTRAGGFAHAGCNLRVTIALGLERSACLIKRRMGYMTGGKS